MIVLFTTLEIEILPFKVPIFSEPDWKAIEVEPRDSFSAYLIGKSNEML